MVRGPVMLDVVALVVGDVGEGVHEDFAIGQYSFIEPVVTGLVAPNEEHGRPSGVERIEDP